ncbi:MAG: GAF domain-containing protein [Rhodobacteraceae bacterium]|nr:GAF domain-containing protein [Paracoccaceae bacterium]
MTEICIDQLRASLEGVVAAVMATSDADGVPNVSMISQVHYVDTERVALSYQFFNKTRRNLLETRRATVQITDPQTCQHHRLELDYLETLTAGPLFERMKAQLAGIASHHGMENVFRLLGADVFRIVSIEPVPGLPSATRPAPRPLLAAARRSCAALDGCCDLEELLDTVMASLEHDFGIRHSILLLVEDGEERLYAVASRGYPTSGAGAEVAFGEGVIGVAAREAVPIRIGHMTREYRYGAAVGDMARRAGLMPETQRIIPFPGLTAPRSQIALPVMVSGKVLGVLFGESEEMMCFSYDEEDALALVASHLGARMALLRQEPPEEDATAPLPPVPRERAVRVRHYPFDQSVFLDNDYLIKGVAGAILWRLLCLHEETGRTDFSLRELRVDPALRLPTHAENLDARLILLRRRLEERKACIRLERSGRGRVGLIVPRGLTLEDAGAVDPA